MGFLDELKRRLAQQEGQHPPLVMNDPGISGRDTRPSDVITGIPQKPTPLPEGDVNAGVRGGMPMGGVKVLSPANQAVITRPRQVMDNVRAAVAQPQQQVSPTVDTQPNFRNDTPEATRDRRTQPRDYIADDEAALRTAEAHPDGFWKRFGSGLLSRAITRRGDEPIPITAHDKEVRHLRNQLGRDVKVAGEQSQIGSQAALRRNRELEPMFEQAKLDLDRQRIQGTLSEHEYQREKDKIEFQQKELDRQSREKVAANRVTSQEKIAGMRPSGDGVRQAKAQAASDEYDQLVRDEEEAGRQKNAAYDTLKAIKENPAYPKEDLTQAQQAAENADKVYQSFAEKKRDAQRRIRENAVGPSAPTQASPVVAPPAGVSEASIRSDGQRNKRSPEAIEKAVQKARSLGWIK